MMATGSKVRLMGSENTHGQTSVSSLANGSTARSADSVSTPGLMVADMKDSSSKTRDKAMVYT